MSVSSRRARPRGALSRASLMVAAAIFSVGVSTTPKAQAANLYWDATGAVVTGGTGNWDTTSAFWSTTAAGSDAAASSFTADDTAFFTGTAGTATLTEPITIGGLVFSGSDFTITGNTLTLDVSSGAPSISVTSGNVATLSSIVAGSDGLTKTDNGVLRLTNGGNSYTGVTTISAGALVISSADALGDATSAISILTTNQVPSSGNLYSFGAGSLVLDGSAAGFELARNINFEGRGSIGDRASAILSIGNNTLSGTLTSAVSPLSPVTFRNSRINSVNGTLTLSGTLISQGTAATTFLNVGGVNTAGVGNFNLTGILSGSGSIEKTGAGTLFLNPSSASGFTGTVRVGGSATGQQSSVRVTQATVGGVSIFGANTGTNANAVIDMNGGVLELRSAGDLNFNALAGGKNVYLRASSTFFTGPAAGGSTINGLATFGTFRVAANNTGTFESRNGYGMTFQAWTQESSNNSSTITNNMGGTLTFTGNAWNNDDASDRTLNLRGTGITVVTGSIDISGAGIKSLSKKGTGAWEIRGISTDIQGEVGIDNGVLVITDFRSISNNAATIQIGSNASNTNLNSTNNHGAGALIIGTSSASLAAGLTTSKVINLQGTTNGATIYANQALASPVIISANLTATGAGAKTLTLGGLNAADNIISGVIPNNSGTNTTGLTKQGAGVWVLSGLNTYTGATTIQSGTLKLRATAASSDVVGSTGAVIFSADSVTQTAGGTLEFRGFLNTATTETLGALTPTAGMGNVSVVSNGASTTLTFASMGTRAVGTGLNFTNPSSGTINFTAAVTGTPNGIVGGFATVGGTNFVASIAAGGLVAAPTYTAGGASFDSTIPGTVGSATKNYFSNGSAATTGNFAANSLKLTNNGSGGAFTGTGVLTITAASVTSLGGILFDNSGGAGSISGYTGITLSTPGTEYIFTVGGSTPANEFTVSSPLTAGGANFTKNGPGVLVLSGASVFTGNAVINEGTVKLSGGAVTFGVNSTAANITSLRQGATLDINAAGASQTIGVGALQGAGTITNSGGGSSTAGTISLGRSTSTGATAFTGILQNGSGVLNVTIDGTTARTQSLLGQSTYTGVTTIATGAQVTVNTLAAGGSASGIGASTNAAANLVFNGSAPTLIYQGNNRVGSLNLGSSSASTDRLFTISGAGAVLSSTASNNNAIIWSNSGAIAHGTVAARTLTLTGTSTGDNTFNPQLTDSGTSPNITSLTKTAAGQWNLGSSNNTYTGLTSVREGVLAVNQSGALPANSPVVLGSTTTSGTLQASGTFARNLAATAVAGTGTVTWGGTTGGGGFAAHTTSLTVTLDSGAALTWGSGGFVGTGGVQTLFFGSASALSDVTFTNAIDLGASARTITVNDNGNTGADFATLSGVLSGAGGIFKNGSGILRLIGLSSYTGTTSVDAGTLVVSSLGGSTGTAATSVGAGNVAMGDGNAIVLGNATTTGGLLQYVGPGETSDRKIRLRGTTAGNQIHADGTGSLVLSNVAHDTTETGSKTLSLRGSSAYTNFITSQLSDNGAGVLSVGVDGGTAWVLTNGTNSYTGTTTVGGGALGIGHNTAISGPLTISNGNVFAHGADRALSVTLNLGNNASSGFYGDYSLTFNGTNNVAAGANNLSTYNSVVTGKSVTFNGLLANSLTALRAWALEGSGETVINGNFTTTTAFGVRIDKGGDGALVLGTSGATSNWNQTSTALDLDRGTLRFSANEAIPSFGAATPTGSAAATSTGYTVSSTAGLTVGQQFTGTNVPAGSRIISIDSATTFTASVAPTTDVASGTALTFAASGGLIISPEFDTTDTATVDLNGTTQTINALTASTDGTVIINNTSSSAATFRFGAKDTAVAFGTGTGNYSIQNTGSGKLDIIKAGNTAVSFGASVPLANKGIIASEGGGSFTVAGQVSAVSGLRATGNSTLALTGELTNPALITSIEVSGGSTLSLLNGAGSAINLTTLNLGAGSGTTILNLNVGESATDTITLLSGGTKTLANTITFNLTDAGLAGATTYTLLSLVDGGLTAFGGSTNLLAGGTPGGFTSMTWGFTDTAVTLTTGTLITGALYWRGTTGTTWNTHLDNWSLNKDGTGAPVSSPGAGTNVIFAWNGAAASPLTTTLEQNFKINKLVFEAGTTTPTSVTISPGAVLTNRLEIAPQLATDGIEMQSAGPTTVTIGANLRLGAAQTWNVASSSGVLTIGGSLLGGANVTKSGAGKVILSAAADPGFNSAGTMTFAFSGGTLELTHAGALGTAAAGNSASLVITDSAFYLNNAASGTVSSPITLSGSTLSAGGANQTYSGAISVSTASVINMADSNGPATNAARNITLSGALTGTAPLTIDSNNTGSGGNQLDGTLTINNAASSWTGNLTFNRGTMTITAAASATVLPADLTFNSFGRLIFQGVDGRTINRAGTLVYAANAVGEIQVDNTTGTQVTDFVVNQNGAVTLGAGSAVRIALSDQLARFNIAGAVTLAGNASISVSNAATRVLTISGVIGETGGARALALNDDLGGWAATNGIITLTAANTYSGGTTLASGTLILGDKASLGTGTLTVSASSTLQASTVLTGANAVTNALALGANLTFSGNNSLQLSGAADLGAAARTITVNGAAGATLTLSGAISNLATADGAQFTLAGNSTGTGVISGGITMTGDVADAAISGGSWTHSGGTSRVGDVLTLSAGATFNLTGGRLDVRNDFVVTGAGTVLNLNFTGGLSFNTATLSGDASLLLRDGALVNLGANNAVVATEFDRLFVGQDADGLKPTLNMGTFSLTTSRLIVGERAATRIGDIVGTGTLTVTGGDIDLFKGLISANLGSTGTTALEKFGFDAMTLSGDNSALASTGASVVYQGTLILDYSTNNATKLRALSALDMRGAALTLVGNASAATSQVVTGLTLANGGSNRITLTPGASQDVLLNLGAITRTASTGTLRIVLPSGTQSATNGAITSSVTANGTMLGYLTVSDGTGTYFATKNANHNLIAITSTTKTNVSTWSGIDNVDNVGGAFSGTFAASGSINTLTFASATSSTVTIASGATLNILSGGVLMTSAVTSGTHTITGGRLTSGITDLVFTQDGAATLDVASVIGSNNAITKTGNGILRLTNAANTFTGAVNVQAGTLQAAGGNAIGDFAAVTLADDQASTFQLLANETIGALSGGSADTNSLAGLLALGAHSLTINHGATDAIYAGLITGSGTITRSAASGVGNLLFRGASGSGFTGALVVNAGLMWIETAATMDASSLTVNRGGAFMVSNNGTTRSGTRLPDTMPVTLNSADGVWNGQNFPSGLAIRTDQNATTNEQVGVLTLGSGASYFYGTANVTGTAIAGILVTDIVRSEASTFAVRGRNLGLAAGQRNFLRIVSGATAETNFAATLVGGAGAAASKTISIVPWIIGETHDATTTTSAHMGNSLVTYAVATGSGSGLRPLALATEYNTFATKAGATDNIRESLAASLTGLLGTTINALVLNNSNATAGSLSITGTGAGQTLAVTSGAMLFTATAAVTGTPAMGITLDGFDGGITVGSTNEYVVFVQNPTSAVAGGTVTATISSPLTSTADITKSGRGVLVLSIANTAGGNTKKTTLNEGALHIDALDKIGGTTGGLVFAGGTLKFGGVFDPSTRTISFLNGGGTFDTNGNDVALANSLGSGTGSFTKSGNGTLTLNAASTYTGATNVSGGTLALGANDLTFGALTVSGAATFSMGALNATVSTLTLSAGSANVLSGSGTLTVTGDATLNQGSIAPILAGAMNLFKSTGSQTVTLSNAANTYTGSTRIQAGTLEIMSVANAGTASPLGAPTGENAIIRLGNAATDGTLLINATGTAGTTNRVISLDGTTGGGVIDNDGTAALILNGDIRGGEAGAKTLTLQGATTGFSNEVVSVISDGLATLGLTKAEEGTWILLGANTYTGTTTVSAGVLQVGNGSTTGSLGAGAVSIASGASLVLNRSDAFAVANVFSGLGTLTVTGGNTYTLNGASTLTGGVLFSGSNITLGASQALGSLSGSSGNLALGSNVLTLSFATGTSTYSGAISGTGSIIKTLAGTQVLSGTNDFSGGVTVTGGLISVSEDAKLGATSGPLVLNGGGLQVTGTTFTSWTHTSARTLTLSGATTFDIADQANTFTLGVSAITAAGNFTKSGLGRLVVTNAMTMGANALNVTTGTLVLENGFTNSTGGSFRVGDSAGSNAAFVQTGGTTVLSQADGETLLVGTGGNSFGSFTIAGGSFQAARLQPTGTAGTNNSGLISVLNGGTLKLTSYFIGGRTSATNTGVVTIAGGTLDLASLATGSGAYGGGRFEVNLGANLGGANTGGTFNAGAKTLNAVMNTTSSQGIINLLGGTLTVGSVSSLASSTFAQFNMNGGVLKAGAASATFLNANLTAANVYSGGVTIDNNGFAITLAKSLTAPAGNGVASVVVTGASGYFTAPMVKLTDGGGNGDATAVAVLNGDGTISVVITNPGTGYTSAPTVTLVGGTSGTAATASAELNSGNTSGGITFQGSSTTTLSGANTYTGGTTVNVGTLALGANNVLADAGGVTIAADGTFDVATFNDTVGTVSLQGGAITGTTGVLTSTSAYDLRNGSVSAILGGSDGLNKTTAGTVTLSGANTYAGVTSVTGGTLAFSAGNQLGNGSATNTLTLNGSTLSYAGSGTANLVANQVVTVGGSGATLNASDAAGTLSLLGGIVTSAAANVTKTGLGAIVVTGSTNLNGGNVTVTAGVLNLGFTATGAGALTVAADATLNLYDGAATTMAITGLTLANGSSLGFDLGTTGVNDVLSLTGTAAITPSVSLNFNALGTLGAGSYDLLSVSAGTLNVADYVLGLAPSGLNYNFSTTNAGQTLRLTTSLLNLVYWKGDVVGGSWSANNAGDTNWASDLAGTTDLAALPIATDTLVFASSGATGPTYVTTLDGDFTADSLKFTTNPTGVTAVAVNQGTSGTLTLTPASANNGISVPTDAGAITIGAPIATGATQTWEVIGGGANGSSLTVTGAVAINHLINKTGAGVLTLSGSNTGSGGINFTAGTLVIGNDGALGTGTFSIGAGTTVNTGATAIVNAGNNVQNWNGNFTFTGTSTLNLGTGAVTLGDNVTLAAGNNLTVGGAIGDGAATFGFTKSGVGVLTLNGANTYGGLTQVANGALNLNGDNSGAAGGVTMAAGTTLNLGHANALGSGTLTLNGGVLNNTSGGTLTLGGSGAQAWNAAFTFTGTHDLVMGAGAVTLGASIPVTVTAGNLTVNGVIDDGLNTFNLEKTGAGTLTLGAANTYGGATTISAGTLAFSANQTLAAATNTLLFGATAASTTPGNLVLTADATFGGAMIVNTNSATASQITIGSGRTLTINANVQIGATTPAVASTVTKLTLNGGGAFNVTTADAGTFIVGGSTAAISQDTTLALTALASTTINVSATGTLRVNPSSGTNLAGAKATLLLPAPVVADTVATATITAGTIAVGNSALFNSQAGQINTISLGTGLTTLNANTINVGTGNRDIGQIIFGQAGGDLKIRAADGTSRATLISIGAAGGGTGTTDPTTNNLVDFSSHDADILVATLNVGNQPRTGNLISEFKFGAGDSSLASVLDATNVNIGFRTGTATTTSILTNRVNISGGAVTFGDGAGTGTGVKVGSSTYNQGGVASTIGELNISGGTVLINNSTALAAAVQLGENVAAGGGTVTAAMNLTGGTTTLVGHIIRNATSLRTTSTVTLNGASAILNMGGNNIGSASALITFNAQAGTLRNLAELNGGGVLTKSTTGTLLLDTANAFTGGVTIDGNGGKIIAGHNNALGTGTVTLAGQNATLELANGITVANAMTVSAAGNPKFIQLQSGATSATYSGNITNNEDVSANFDLSASAGGTLTISGNISSGHALAGIEKIGAGTVSLSGANSYTGSTTITTGTLIAASGALASTSGITVGASGTLSAVDFNSAAPLTLSGTASAATISGTGLTIAGAVSNAGTATDALNFTASGGTITLASLTGAGKTTFGSAATITGGISVGVVNVAGLLTADVSGGTVNAGSMTGAVSSSVTVTGLLTGAITAGTNALGSLSSTSVTGGTNTITGAATVALVNGGTTTVGGVAAITTLTTGTVNLNGATSSIGTLTAGTVNLGTTALTVNDGTFAGLLAGATGSLIKATAGTLTLSGANTFGGGTTINAGTLTISDVGALGAGSVTVAVGATLNLNSLGVANVITRLTDGTNFGTVTGGISSASISATAPAVVTTVLTGPDGLTRTGGELTLTTPNFYTGATAASGATSVIKAAFLSDTSSSLGASTLSNPANLVLTSGAKLEFTGGTTTSTSRSFTINESAGIASTGTGSLEFTTSSTFATSGTAPELKLTASSSGGTNRFAAALAVGSTELSTLAIDGTGTWVIGGNSNRFKGDIRIEAAAGATLGFESGSLGMGSGYSTSVIRLNNNTVLVWSGANTDDISSRLQIPTGATAKMNLGANDVTFAAAPKDANGAALTSGTIQKSGTGTLKIATAVSSPGLNFDVPTGKLTINGTVGNVTLASGSTLGGAGTVGAVTTVSGAIIGPGNSPGTLTSSSVSLVGGTIYEWQVQNANGAAGTGYDTLAVTGALDVSGASSGNPINLKIVSLAGTGDGTALGNPLNFGPPAGASSIRTFTFATVGSLNLGANLNISDAFTIDVDQFKYSDGSSSNAGLWSLSFANNAITLTAVPEPSTYGFGLGALALAAAAIRRRKRQAKA